jgi:hypothetical protein
MWFSIFFENALVNRVTEALPSSAERLTGGRVLGTSTNKGYSA